jgi:acyl phosphate:glycerol-3-phosphate acyltransferase
VDWIQELIAAIVAFLVGSIPTGYLVARAYGVDIRKVGSGNIGATNVLRSVNRWAGRGVFVVDMLKGFLPVFLAPVCLPLPDPSVIQVIACLCAILGHNYTPWLGFRGGKGVATAAGGFLAISWPALLLAAAIWLVVFFLSHYVSLGSIFAVAALPCLVFGFSRNWTFTAFATLVAVVTILRHKANIQRLMAGTEHKFTKKPS